MVARSLAIFFACLSALGLFARLDGAVYDSTLLWLDLRVVPDWTATLLLAGGLAGFMAIGAGRREKALVLIPATFCAIAMVDAIRFYALLSYGRIESSFPIALSLLIAIALGAVAWHAARVIKAAPTLPQGPARLALFWAGAITMVGGWAVLFSLLQMWCYGKTDYARKADAIVVLGARVYADGRLSDALADRVRSGVALYQQELAPTLIFSGGPGDGAVNEPAAMREYAMSLGVPAEAIREDPGGINTQATINYLSAHHAGERILAVSHFYHLPRIKLAADKQHVRLLTSPARETYTLSQMPRFIAREVAAFWVYLFR